MEILSQLLHTHTATHTHTHTHTRARARIHKLIINNKITIFMIIKGLMS